MTPLTWGRTRLPACLVLPLALASTPCLAVDSLREQEMQQCLPGEIATWGDSLDRPAVSGSMLFLYKHIGAPSWFDESRVLGHVRLAAQAWSECGVIAKVDRFSPGTHLPDNGVLVQWSDDESRHNFGLANLGNKTLNLGPAAFQLLKARNPAADSAQTLQMVISHEMGHLFGVMSHSRRCVDVTSYYDNGKGEVCSIRGGGVRPAGVEYRATLPTTCDIQRCKAANKLR